MTLVFDYAPILQGSFTNLPTAGDQITYASNTAVADTSFREYYDINQVSISLWYTPEEDGGGTADRTLWRQGSNAGRLRIVQSTALLNWAFGGDSLNVDISGWTAGTTYHIVVRADSKNTLDGTNYMCISVNDSHTFGATSAPTPSQSNTFNFSDGGGINNPEGIIEGWTIYRRVLYDGTYGVDVGNGDEIAAIYASGSGKDPCEVTGSWDVVFALPTDQDGGAIATGTGHAWSHPHSSNVPTDWHMMTTYGSSGWSTKGTPSAGPADITATEKIYAGGYEWTADADAEGIEQSFTSLTAGENYVIRVLAHTDTADDIRVLVYDDTNSAAITTYLFGASSTKTAPGVALITFELPTVARNGAAADCTAITISVEATAASQTVYAHQFEMLVNLLDNPSMETGSGTPWIADGWTNNNLTGTESEQETTIVHSGASSLQYNIAAAGAHNQQFNNRTVGTFFVIGGWAWSATATDLTLDAGGGQAKQSVASGSMLFESGAGSAWEHIVAVGRYTSTTLTVRARGTNCVAAAYWDDLYAFELAPVSLTVTPASEANSTESTGLRVDGQDICTQTISNVTATAGTLRFDVTPRHDSSTVGDFDMTAGVAFIARFIGATNYIEVRHTASPDIILRWNDGGGIVSGTWGSPGLVAGTTYTFVIEYDTAGATLTVDGTLRATAAAALDFSADPLTDAYYGSDQNGEYAYDATFAAPTP